MPTPRKLSDASTTMAHPNEMLANTMNVAAQFGCHMAHNDPPVAGSNGACRQHVVNLFDAERLRAYRPGRTRYEHRTSKQSPHW